MLLSVCLSAKRRTGKENYFQETCLFFFFVNNLFLLFFASDMTLKAISALL